MSNWLKKDSEKYKFRFKLSSKSFKGFTLQPLIFDEQMNIQLLPIIYGDSDMSKQVTEEISLNIIILSKLYYQGEN